jgi:iron(III) transport system substrate-binding protein
MPAPRLHRTLLGLLALLPAACGGPVDAGGAQEPGLVSVYCALDQEHSSAMLKRFEAETGVRVKARFDTEANKTVGLVSAIVEEAANPRCDVFWNNELAHTVRLGQKGLLAPYASAQAAGIPDRFRAADGLWTGFAARARVLIVNTELLPDPEEWPSSMWDLLDAKWKGRCAIARPLTGTTLTHFAALRGVLGEREFTRFVDGLFANGVVFLQSNGATMRQVAEGKLAFAFTDTDDYHVAHGKGHPVACVFPDQGEDQVGTMLIPNSVAVVKGAPHPEAARKLVDWLLSETTEASLAAAKSAQIPLRPAVAPPADPGIKRIDAFRMMAWDPEAAAAALESTLVAMNKRF